MLSSLHTPLGASHVLTPLCPWSLLDLLSCFAVNLFFSCQSTYLLNGTMYHIHIWGWNPLQ